MMYVNNPYKIIYELRDDIAELSERCREQEADIKELLKEREWISAKDRLPENGVLILVAYAVSYGRRTVIMVDTAMHQSYGFCGGGYDNFRSLYNYNAEVTHWMPLPNPPKRDDADA